SSATVLRFKRIPNDGLEANQFARSEIFAFSSIDHSTHETRLSLPETPAFRKRVNTDPSIPGAGGVPSRICNGSPEGAEEIVGNKAAWASSPYSCASSHTKT